MTHIYSSIDVLPPPVYICDIGHDARLGINSIAHIKYKINGRFLLQYETQAFHLQATT